MPGYEIFDNEERDAVNEIFDLNGGVLFAHGFDNIRKGIYKVREFEDAIRKKFNVPYAQAVSSCTAALRVALAAINIQKDDEVIIPSFTFVATAEAIIEAGAKVVVADIDESLNLCPSDFENAITKKTKAVVAVHMMSSPANMDRICEIATKYDLKVIEDAAWGVGATWKGRPLGTIGDIGCYSFDAGKCISTGEGGMIITHEIDFFEKCRAFHDHGHEYSSSFSRGEEGAIGAGFNFRMTELQAAVGIVQLKKLNRIIDSQRANKKYLKSILKDAGFPYHFRKHNDEDGDGGDALFFRLQSKNEAKLFVKQLKLKNIPTKNVPDAMRWHFTKYWKHIFEKSDLYNSNYGIVWKKSADILESSIALPILINSTKEDLDILSENLIKISKKI